MQFNFHTKAAGEFEVFKHANDGTLVSVSKVKNLITDFGLADVKNTFWASCFTKLVVGSGTNAPQVSDTTLQSFLVGSSTYASTPQSSSVVTSSSIIMTRSFLLTNNTGSGITINELGTTRAATLNSSSQLFSRAVISPGIAVANGETITVLYKLTLLIPGNTTSTFSFTNASAPTNSAGIIARPIALVNSNGSNEAPTGFPSAESKVFEPYLMRSQGYFSWFGGGPFTTTFNLARSAYLSNPSSENNGDVASPSGQGSTTTVDVGSFAQQTYFIITSGSTATLGGFAFYARNVSASSTGRTSGLWCAFNSLYTVPTNHFVKITFNQSWGRA